MDPETHVRHSSNNTTLYVVLGILGGFLIMCMGMPLLIVVCLAAIQILGKNANSAFGTVGMSIGATVGTTGTSSPREKQAEQAARAFLDDLAANRLDLAYRRCSPDFQQLHTLDDFKALVRARPGLLKQRSYTIDQERAAALGQELLAFRAIVRGERNWEHRVTLEMISEAGEWKVDDIEIENLMEGGP
jgi:hypothetical protein